jgi:amino acid transporter
MLKTRKFQLDKYKIIQQIKNHFNNWQVFITTALSMLGYLGGEILSVHRVLYASARDGLFPKP